MVVLDILFLGVVFVAAVKDYKSYIIPDTVSIIALMLALIKAIINQHLVSTVVTGITVFIILFVISLISNGLGGGDIKLIAVVMAYMGLWAGIFAIALACILTLIYLKINKIKNTFFAPFLFSGCLAMCFFNYL